MHFFPHQLTLFLTYYSVSSPLRKLRLSTYHPNAGRECAGHSKSFLGEQRGVSGDAFGYCTRGTVSPEQSLPHWEGSHASPAPISHARTEIPLVGREAGCPEPFLLTGREGRGSLCHPFSECQHSRGCPATPRLFTDSQKVCFYGESSDWEESVHVMSQLLSSGGTVL